MAFPNDTILNIIWQCKRWWLQTPYYTCTLWLLSNWRIILRKVTVLINRRIENIVIYMIFCSENKIKDEKEKEKRQAFTKELLAYKKSFSKRCNITLHSLPKPREKNRNTSKKGIMALQRKRASPSLGMESLKMKKVLINSSHPTLTKTSRIWGHILSNKRRMMKAWSLPMMIAHGTCLEEREFLDPFLCFYFL